jgi:hypothetical protein
VLSIHAGDDVGDDVGDGSGDGSRGSVSVAEAMEGELVRLGARHPPSADTTMTAARALVTLVTSQDIVWAPGQAVQGYEGNLSNEPALTLYPEHFSDTHGKRPNCSNSFDFKYIELFAGIGGFKIGCVFIHSRSINFFVLIAYFLF